LNGTSDHYIVPLPCSSIGKGLFFTIFIQEVIFAMDADPSGGNLFLKYGGEGIFHLILSV